MSKEIRRIKNLAWMKRSSYWLVKALENFLWNSLANLDFFVIFFLITKKSAKTDREEVALVPCFGVWQLLMVGTGEEL